MAAWEPAPEEPERPPLPEASDEPQQSAAPEQLGFDVQDGPEPLRYVGEIFRILREREYNPALMRLHVLGGGSCLVRNFGVYEAERVTIYEDICVTAKGYEYLCETDDGQRCVIAVNARTGQQERIQTSDVSGGVQMQF